MTCQTNYTYSLLTENRLESTFTNFIFLLSGPLWHAKVVRLKAHYSFNYTNIESFKTIVWRCLLEALVFISTIFWVLDYVLSVAQGSCWNTFFWYKSSEWDTSNNNNNKTKWLYFTLYLIAVPTNTWNVHESLEPFLLHFVSGVTWIIMLKDPKGQNSLCELCLSFDSRWEALMKPNSIICRSAPAQTT